MKNTAYITELQKQIPQSVIAFGLTNIGCIQEGITNNIVVPSKNEKEEHTETPYKSPVHLAKKRGLKIDLIRVANAIYESGYVTDEFGGRVSKKEYFKAIGKCFNVDLDNYDIDLSNSMAVGTSMERQERVFEELKKKHNEIFNSK